MPVAEKELIARIRRRTRAARAIVRGIGDDCAVLRIPPGHEALVTTDFSLEGIHFRREWHPPDSVGHRCLARGLSDIAAMGGEPIAAFLSLAAPRDLPQSWIEDFLDGFLRLAKRFRVVLAGGDIAQSPAGVLADIVLLGSVPQGKAILRSKARPGDLIYVTGSLGGSSAVLAQLLSGRHNEIKPAKHPEHFYPTPRIEVARRLRNLASAMIDISDGLSTDLTHICDESHVGAVVEKSAIPSARLERRPVDLKFALHGGEDYELVFTARPTKRIPALITDVPVTKVGEIVRQRRIRIKMDDGRVQSLPPQGWEHFAIA